MNMLQDETSPYLLQHKDNPVAWMPWGAAALEKAKAEQKPILLSVGYSACHWCHVMAHESFEDPATAALMNQHFINIKVDREERPDLDALYQNALALMGKQGGWPLTMFLTPSLEPFWGGTYFPPQPRYGMPAFREILRGVAEAYVKDQDKIAHNVASLAAALAKINQGSKGPLLNPEALNKVGRHFLGLIDPAHGGIGTAPKFPNLPIINFLWGSYIRTGADAYKSAVIHSLTQMCQGGIYDHVGGGFARYAVDGEWLVPHFEKMLCDNAQFISLLAEVCKETRNPLFAARVAETVEWAMRDMAVAHEGDTAFAAALDADSEGPDGKKEEGQYYVWTAEEIAQILGAGAEKFGRVYDVTRFGNWEGKNILNRLKSPDPAPEAEEAKLRRLREKLRAARDRRAPPGRDDKVLADINGLMIAALAKAGEAFGKNEWIAAAESAFAFVTRRMMKADNALFHSFCAGKPRHEGVLDDYASMAQAALALFDVTQEEKYIRQAESWMKVLDEQFIDAINGGYYMSAAHVKDVIVRAKSAHDNATPSGNGTLVGVLAKLHQLTGKEAYAAQARKTAEAFSGEVAQHFFPFATLLDNSDSLMDPATLVVVTNENGDELYQSVSRSLSWPHLVRFVTAPGIPYPASHPAHGKTLMDGITTAYLCRGPQCRAPVTNAAELESLLRQERRGGKTAANDDG